MKKLTETLSQFKYYHIIFLILIILIGSYLRLIGLDKPSGLWSDEIEGYTGASMAFPFGILKFIHENGIHPPLYYFLLHFWMSIFGNDDIYLRLLSAIIGIITIYVGYLIGKQLNSRNYGLILALFISINPLLVYYSYEVRFYSLVVLFVSLSIYFMLKIQADANKINLAGYCISSLLCLYTSSLGLLYIGIQTIVFSLYAYFLNKKIFKPFLITSIIAFTLFLPWSFEMFYQYKIAGGIGKYHFSGVFDWCPLKFIDIIYTIMDWFSPALINLFPNYENFYLRVFHKGNFLIVICIYFLIPAICLAGIINSIRSRNHNCLILFTTGLIFLCVEILFSLSGKFGIIDRYTLSTAIIMIILASYGLYSLKSKTLKTFLILMYCLPVIFVNIFASNSVSNVYRGGGLKPIAQILINYNINKDDILVMPYLGVYIKKYLPHKSYELANYNMIDTFYFPDKKKLQIIFDEELVNNINTSNAKELLFTYITDSNIAKPLENYFKRDILEKLKPNSRVFLVISELHYTKSDLLSYKNNYKLYNEQILSCMILTKNYSDLYQLSNKYLRLIKAEIQDNSTKIYIFSPKKPE